LDRAASGLLTAIHQASPDGTQVASDPYVREVLEFAAGSVEVVRGQFLALLFRVLEDIRQRIALNPEDERSCIEDFCRRLTEADSAYRLIDLFKETLRTLSALSSDPVRGSQEVRLRTTLCYIEEHFNRPLRLPQVAKRSGFSVPVFCRVFKRATGMSFAAYLNKVRVERSKPLLKNGRLNLLQVGQACGFQTAHQFIRNFKRWTGRTPGHFRQEASQASR
jgi:AraC-like DNA-binding protein